MVVMAFFLTSSDENRQKRISIIAGRHGGGGAIAGADPNDRDKRRAEIAKKLNIPIKKAEYKNDAYTRTDNMNFNFPIDAYQSIY